MCVSRPVKFLRPIDAYYEFCDKPLSEAKLGYGLFDPREYISMTFYSKLKRFHSKKGIWKCYLQIGDNFVSAEKY